MSDLGCCQRIGCGNRAVAVTKTGVGQCQAHYDDLPTWLRCEGCNSHVARIVELEAALQEAKERESEERGRAVSALRQRDVGRLALAAEKKARRKAEERAERLRSYASLALRACHTKNMSPLQPGDLDAPKEDT